MKHTTLPNGVATYMAEHYDGQVESPLIFPSEHTISFFEDSLPSAIETEMAHLYANLFSSPEKFRAYGQLSKVNTYVARVNGRATAIFIFRREGNKIHILNEQIYIPGAEIARFAKYIFDKYASVKIICFKTVDTTLTRFHYPYQRTYFTNDVVLALPKSVSEYQKSLGKSTQENIKRYMKLLKRDFPSHEFQVHEKNEGGDALFQTIIDFNRARMSGKNKVSGITNAEAERLHSLVRKCGMVCALMIDGRVCAGTICYQFGDNYFMRVIAHDSVYNAYRLGLLCCYLTIGECIIRGGENYHFLWGWEEYKYRFHGKHRDFDSLTIYRSRFRFLLNIIPIIKLAVKTSITKAKLWLLDPSNKDSALAMLTHRLMKKLKGSVKANKHY
ncbi:MAG: GNAT family N-acetyltransferase [Burkholderiaceae bacterium]